MFRHARLLVAIAFLLSGAIIIDGAQVRRTYSRVQFARGTTSTIIKKHLGSDYFHYYYLGASAGQTMIVHISSPQGTAVVTISKRNGKLLPGAAGVDDWSGTLPRNGDYELVVGARGGNPADYTLEITIR
jgi:hypothetical protein